MLGEWDPGRYAVELVGVLLSGSGISYLLLETDPTIVELAEVAFPLLLGVLVMGYGSWLRHTGMDSVSLEVVGVAAALGGVAFAFVTGWLLYVATLELAVVHGTTFILLNGIAIGVVAGGFLGTLYMSLQERQRAFRRRNQELRRQNERLDQFASIVSHDLRNPLNVAQGRLELAEETGEPTHFEALGGALDRIDSILTDMLAFARQGRTVEEVETVLLGDLARSAWDTVETGDVSLSVEGQLEFEAHESRLSQGLENLFRNSIEHGAEGVTSVRVGPIDETGFYVADDGRGIPEGDREKVFESGFSTTQDGTGFGLPIVKAVIEAHGWEIAITESEDGGARFEVTGLEGTRRTTGRAEGGGVRSR